MPQQQTPYLDKTRFPLSSQDGLTLQQQKLIDAVNLDDLKEMLDQGKPLSERQHAILRELEQKRAL